MTALPSAAECELAAPVLARRLIVYRELFAAACDELRAAQQRERRLREQLDEQRELWARCAERLMSE